VTLKVCLVLLLDDKSFLTGLTTRPQDFEAVLPPRFQNRRAKFFPRRHLPGFDKPLGFTLQAFLCEFIHGPSLPGAFAW